MRGRALGRGGVGRSSGDRGSAGIWVLALSGVVLLAGTASVLAGLAIITRHAAGTAADLAALAAAGDALSGSQAACHLAEEIAHANGAELAACSLSPDGVADVAATVSVRFGALGLGLARAQARAGPAALEGADDSAPAGDRVSRSDGRNVRAGLDAPVPGTTLNWSVAVAGRCGT